jgi:hypothetical protein
VHLQIEEGPHFGAAFLSSSGSAEGPHQLVIKPIPEEFAPGFFGNFSKFFQKS